MFAPITQDPQDAKSARMLKHQTVACTSSEVNMGSFHCDHVDHTRSMRSVKQDWEKLYRAAILEWNPSKLRRRIEDAEAAILERLRSSSNSPGNSRKERDSIARALRILRLLRKPGEGQ